MFGLIIFKLCVVHMCSHVFTCVLSLVKNRRVP